MIQELRIRSLGVIDEAVVPFAPGFTVLTGETGAGKTMVLSGLGLIRMRQDRVDEAIDAFEKALTVHPHLEAARRHRDALRRKRRDGAI